jgi:hypothetical protein
MDIVSSAVVEAVIFCFLECCYVELLIFQIQNLQTVVGC